MQFIKEIQNLPPFTFDDIVLLPQYSEVDSRLDSRLNTESKLADYTFKTPIISANMDCVTGPEMAVAMNTAGGFGIVHRFFKTPEERKQSLMSLYNFPYGVSVGIADSEIDFIAANRHMIPFICVDIAHAHNKKCIEFVKRLKKEFATPVVVGNVSTYDGAKAFVDLGVNGVKIGQGPGNACKTREVAGCGSPQGSAIYSAYQATKGTNTKLIADGGMKKPADFVKAIALGANFVMMGRVLAGADESSAKECVSSTNYKVYRGQSSSELQKDMNIYRDNVAPEGVQFLVLKSGPVVGTLEYFMGGLRSAMSYTGAFTLQEFRERAELLFVGHNSYIEGTPHGMQ